jgi:hypothetical protein
MKIQDRLWSRIKERLMTEVELWRPIAGFEAYEVSNMGRVRRAVDGIRTYVGRIIKTHIGTGGYVNISLNNKDKKRCTKSLHTIVAKAFIPNPENLPEVNHLGPKIDCRASMLEWCTKRQNEIHKMNRGIGVFLVTKGRWKAWRAYYNPIPYHKKHIGYFKTRKAALEARKAYVKRLSK